MATDMSLWRNIKRSKTNVVRLPKKQPTRTKIEKGCVSLRDEQSDFPFSTSSPNAIVTSWSPSLHTVMTRKSQAKGTTGSRPYVTVHPIQISSQTHWLKPLAAGAYQLISTAQNGTTSCFPPRNDQSPTGMHWPSSPMPMILLLAKPYGLLEAESSSDEEAEENYKNNEEGEGIDLTKPSADNSDDEYYNEGEGGDFYNDDDKEFVNDEEEGGEESSGSDAKDTEKDLDDDCIPEADKDW
ncbi:hypothetical protein VP01_1660g1 [Puccinia sorghi]|uniref:Transcription factor Iwr1 domain-containing protein n=1 Tax=Puccinia sorghi TaxID=27349 RepID=A0A0L6VGC9_9BASI|nr:hypothetical protein VP01_1660g1 [Puccinia sorghi]